MATEKAETDRVPLTLALSTIAYLEELVRQGTHGTSVPGVARTLIEEGIRLVIKDARRPAKNEKPPAGHCRRFWRFIIKGRYRLLLRPGATKGFGSCRANYISNSCK
jgi:hypothetical protein